MKNQKVRFITQAAMIAAIYIVLLLVFEPLSFSGIQCRIAEALTILPYFTPAAIPGLALGCLLGNFIAGAHILDILFGSLATLIGAIFSYVLRKNKYLVPIPPILANALIIPWVIKFAFADATPISILIVTVGLGEVLSCGVLGWLLLITINKNNHLKSILFHNKSFE